MEWTPKQKSAYKVNSGKKFPTASAGNHVNLDLSYSIQENHSINILAMPAGQYEYQQSTK